MQIISWILLGGLTGALAAASVQPALVPLGVAVAVVVGLAVIKIEEGK